MKELTIIIDSWGHKELKEYLTSINGILEVIINNEDNLQIYIKYNPELINIKVIKMEIFLFLDIFKIPSLLAFDKHSTTSTRQYSLVLVREDICCDYCFKGAIDDLFDIEGIEKVDSNFFEEYYQKKDDERENFIINISYNPKLISPGKIKQIIENLNI